MKIWLWSLLLMVWLLVLLESLSSQWIDLKDTVLSQMAMSGMWYVFCYVLLILAWQLWRFGQSHQRKQQFRQGQFKQLQLKQPVNPSHLTVGNKNSNGLVTMVNVISVMLLFIGISLHGLLQYHSHTANQLTQMVQVIAHIRIDGLSDGVADTRYQSHYAQTATIVHAMPLSAQATSTQTTSTQVTSTQATSTQPTGVSSQDGMAKTAHVSFIANPYYHNDHSQPADIDTDTDTDIINDAATDISIKTEAHLNAPMNTLVGSQVLISAMNQSLANGQIEALFVSQPSKTSTGQPTIRQVPLDSLVDGQELIVPLLLQPLPNHQSKQVGFNGRRWLTTRDIQAQAKWLPMNNHQWHEQAQMMHQMMPRVKTHAVASNTLWQQMMGRLTLLRWQLRQHFMQFDASTPAQQQAQAVALSLLTGDRALINKSTKHLYQLSGISHLLAISGTHVLFLAIVFASVAMAGIERFAVRAYDHMPRWQWRWGLTVGMAALYALFTGFDVPAARTLWMLLAVGIARWLLLPISGLQVVMLVAAVMVWFNPLVLWQAGFWLSFVAVMLLIGYEQAFMANIKSTSGDNFSANNFSANNNDGDNKAKTCQQLKQFVLLQLWIFVTLLPLSLWIFGKVSLWGVLVNMFAIGLYGWVIVPCNLLAGLLYLLSPTLANMLWAGVIGLLTHLHASLAWITGANIGDGESDAMSSAWLYYDVSLGVLVLVILALWLVVFFKGHHGLRTWTCLPLSAIVMLTVFPNVFLSSKTLTSLSVIQTDDRQQKSDPAILTLLALGENMNRQGVRVSLLHIPKNQNYDVQNWLILSQVNQKDIALKDLQKTTNNALLNKDWPNKQRHHVTNDTLMNGLKENLAAKRITRLTGIIVQNPDKQLAMLTARLSHDIPVQYWWQAGNGAFLRQLTQLESTATSPISCQVQMPNNNALNNNTLNNNALNSNGFVSTAIQAVSGFAKIDDPSVWTCSLLLKFETGIVVQSEYPTHMLSGGKQQADNLAQISSGTSPSPVYQQVFLDGGMGVRQWRLWHTWCSEQSLVSSHFTSSPTSSPASALWLLSHHSPLPSLMNDDHLINELQDRMGKPDAVRLSDSSEQKSAQSQQWLWQMTSLLNKLNHQN